MEVVSYPASFFLVSHGNDVCSVVHGVLILYTSCEPIPKFLWSSVKKAKFIKTESVIYYALENDECYVCIIRVFSQALEVIFKQFSHTMSSVDEKKRSELKYMSLT